MTAESPGGVEKFHSSLEDLVGNSKSLITKLTRLDDKNDIQAREIIRASREITSITKTFCCTYEKMDGKLRKSCTNFGQHEKESSLELGYIT